MGVIPTFREVLAKSGFDIQELTVEQTDALWIEYDQLIRDRVQELRRSSDFPGSPGLLNQMLAEDTIAAHLGIGWVEENIVRPKSKKYLAYESHRLYKALSLYRVQELARRLYQLQSFPWFDIVLDAVRTRELSGAAFELDALWTLRIASPYVETRRESGVKGRDYDAFALMGDHLVPVEAKAKDDTTPWSTKTVINTVKNAARQLPSGEVGLLFLRVPTAWVGPALEESFVDALAEGTRQTTRVGAIITAIDKPHLNTENTASVSRHFHYFATPECPEHIWSFCMRFKQFWDAEVNLMAPEPPF
jgi:hypothetical protein